MNVRVDDARMQQYYLPKNKNEVKQSNNIAFNELLQEKILTAMNLNDQLSNSPNKPLPSSFFSNFMSMLNPAQSFMNMPTMMGSSPYDILMDRYRNQMNSYASDGRLSTTESSNKINGPTKFNSIIQEAAKKYNVDEQLIHAIIKTESNYNPNAKSHAGAAGLMQLMPATARYLGVSDRYDVKQNIFGGTKYISDMLRQHNGNLTLALAAYNAGPGNVKKYGGIPPFKETQNYVKKIQNLLT